MWFGGLVVWWFVGEWASGRVEAVTRLDRREEAVGSGGWKAAVPMAEELRTGTRTSPRRLAQARASTG